MSEYHFPDWIEVEGYPDDDRYPPEDMIVLVDVKGKGICPGRFNFDAWRWEWVMLEIEDVYPHKGTNLAAHIEHQRESYDPYVKRWMFFPPKKGSQ